MPKIKCSNQPNLICLLKIKQTKLIKSISKRKTQTFMLKTPTVYVLKVKIDCENRLTGHVK